MDPDRLRRDILKYLKTHNVMTISSCHKNVPWAAAVFYASDGFDLYFFSNPRSRHGKNMAANPVVSAAIHEDYRDWQEIRGIQLEGRAELLRSPKLQARFWEVYSRKFPFVKEFLRQGQATAELRSKLSRIRLYRIVPTAVWYLDNRRGFGHREKLDLTTG
ncbi:MAG: pyridoxamine 5'-phosphate oxidase family protein [Acidobacteria bacterium]|nr:pyridoxamine 5'-phosphate oxidase family protein [Acidobacteriota bacterium]